MLPIKPEMKKYEVIWTEKQLKQLVQKMDRLEEFAFDTETNTLRVNGPNKDFKTIGISISWGQYSNYYIPIGHLLEESKQLSSNRVAKALKPIFEKEDLRLIGHNIIFDLHVLARMGINVKTRDLWDTMVASWLIDENNPKGLKDCSTRELGVNQSRFDECLKTVTKEEKKMFGLRANQKPTFDLVRVEIGAPYALDDAFYTWCLYLHFYDLLEKEDMLNIFNKQYKDFAYTLFEMEERGVEVDVEKLVEMGEQMEEDLEELQFNIYELAGIEFNPNSNQQLAELLFKCEDYKNPNEDILNVSFNFPVISVTAKGMPQTNNRVLETLVKKEYKDRRKREGIELVKNLLEFKKLRKLKTAFVDGLLEEIYDDGKVHPNYNIVGTTSGRISSSSPNLQQMPNASDEDKYQIRSVFIGSKNEQGERNKIVAWDYANLEMRVLAHFSLDEKLVETFINGHDSHGSTAVNMFGLDCTADECKKLYPEERQVGKTLNFGLMYGMSAFTLYETLTSPPNNVDLDREELLKRYNVKNGKDVAQVYYDKYFETYKGVAKFIRNQKRFAHRNGYVYTLVGRKRRLHNINSQDFKTVGYEERLSVNQPIQGSAADIVINAQLRVAKCEKLKELGVKMILQVHDELVFECPEENVEEANKLIKEYMENPFGSDVQLNVPLEVDGGVGNSYQEAC